MKGISALVALAIIISVVITASIITALWFSGIVGNYLSSSSLNYELRGLGDPTFYGSGYLFKVKLIDKSACVTMESLTINNRPYSSYSDYGEDSIIIEGSEGKLLRIHDNPSLKENSVTFELFSNNLVNTKFSYAEGIAVNSTFNKCVIRTVVSIPKHSYTSPTVSTKVPPFKEGIKLLDIIWWGFAPLPPRDGETLATFDGSKLSIYYVIYKGSWSNFNYFLIKEISNFDVSNPHVFRVVFTYLQNSGTIKFTWFIDGVKVCEYITSFSYISIWEVSTSTPDELGYHADFKVDDVVMKSFRGSDEYLSIHEGFSSGLDSSWISVSGNYDLPKDNYALPSEDVVICNDSIIYAHLPISEFSAGESVNLCVLLSNGAKLCQVTEIP